MLGRCCSGTAVRGVNAMGDGAFLSPRSRLGRRKHPETKSFLRQQWGGIHSLEQGCSKCSQRHRHNPGASWKCTVSGFTQDLLSQDLHCNNIPKRLVCT